MYIESSLNSCSKSLLNYYDRKTKNIISELANIICKKVI